MKSTRFFLSSSIATVLLALATANAYPASHPSPPTMDADAFFAALKAWNSTHLAQDPTSNRSAAELAAQAKQGDAMAYSELAGRAFMQNQMQIALDENLKAVALGLTSPVAFMGSEQLMTQPRSGGADPQRLRLREYNAAWDLVAVIRGDEYGAGLFEFELKGNIGEEPLPAERVADVCRMAVVNYQRVQQTRMALGKPPFTAADNAPQTVFMSEDNVWPISYCPELPIPKMRCEEVQLNGHSDKGKLGPGMKAFRCEGEASKIALAIPPAVSAAPVAIATSVLPAASHLMSPVSTEPLADGMEGAPDSGSDSDPEVQYHFTVGKRLYVIESAGGGVTHEPDKDDGAFEVPSAPIYIDGPIYSGAVDGDPVLLYQTAFEEQGGRTEVNYLVRLGASSLQTKWIISGVPSGFQPGLISGTTAFLAGTGFLGAIDLQSGKYRWCLPDLAKQLPGAFDAVQAPFIRGRTVMMESAHAKPGGKRDFVSVDLDKQAVDTNVAHQGTLSVTTECPYIR